MTSCSCTRRDILVAGLAASALPWSSALAQESTAAIDIHHHVLPPFYKPLAAPWFNQFASDVDTVLAWTPETSLRAMDRAGIEQSVLSISAPGLDFDRGTADRDLARRCNDYMAGLVEAHAGRFRFFAALPMPQVDASIVEADRARSLPGCAGLGLMTSYDGAYLGETAFLPLFEAVSAHAPLIYVHPTLAPCCAGLNPGITDVLIEMPVDTGRSISSLLWSGVFSRFSGIRFIFSHGGGILPMIAERVSAMGFVDPALNQRVPEGPAAALAKLYVDTASATQAPVLAALQAWLPPSQILYGTDFPWGSPDRALQALDRLGLPPALLADIRRGNALRLLGV